ncbi:hypothetical protein BDQ17DRAFT_1419835 [Cyathus striatus]|nr:hypothetical protein BDQ17DRAFT_1419835 [Cyathus striatus]
MHPIRNQTKRDKLPNRPSGSPSQIPPAQSTFAAIPSQILAQPIVVSPPASTPFSPLSPLLLRAACCVDPTPTSLWPFIPGPFLFFPMGPHGDPVKSYNSPETAMFYTTQH